MFVQIVILWILIKLSAPAWLYVLLGIAFILKCVSIGMKIDEALKGINE